MKKLIKIITTQESDLLDIRFWPTDICNFTCNYCFPGSVTNKLRYPKNVDTVIKNFRILFDTYVKNHNKKKFKINIVGGGEPSLWPHLKYFTEEIKKQHEVYIKLTTNGSRSLRWFQENTDFIDKFTMSCHHKDVDLDSFIENCDWIYEIGKEPGVLMLMDFMHWDKCVSYIDKMLCSKHPWSIQAKEVVSSPNHDITNYTEDQLNYLKQPLKRLPTSDRLLKNLSDFRIYESIALYDDDSAIPATPNKYIFDNVNNFKGWSCKVAIENLVITHDGSISGSCQDQIFKDANINLFSEDFEEKFKKSALDLEIIKCRFEKCACQPDTHITKWRS